MTENSSVWGSGAGVAQDAGSPSLFGGFIGQVQASTATPPLVIGAPSAPAGELWTDDAFNPGSISPRPWIAESYLLRRAITAIIGPAGAGKSAHIMKWMVCSALGLKFGGFAPKSKFKALIYNVEDDRFEQQRRLTAALQSVGKQPADIVGQIIRVGPTYTGTLFARSVDKFLINTAAMDELEAVVLQYQPDVLVLDPFVELHTEDENNNTAIREVLAQLRALAERHDVAIALLVHTPKGIVEPGNLDAARGASAIGGAVRLALTLTPMTEAEAAENGVPPGGHGHYVRCQGAKNSYGVKAESEWFHRAVYTLVNGEQVATPVPWQPPVVQITPALLAQLGAAIEAGTPEGPYSPQLTDKPLSVRRLFLLQGITTKTNQEAALAALLTGGYERAKYKNGARNLIWGLRSTAGEPAAWKWQK